jgi:hypothetical protein
MLFSPSSPLVLGKKVRREVFLSLAYLLIEIGHNLASGESDISILRLLIIIAHLLLIVRLFSCLALGEYFSKGK